MTSEHQAVILKLYAAGGVTANRLATKFGYCYTSVRDFIRRSGVEIYHGERGCKSCAEAKRYCDFHRKLRAAEWKHNDYRNDQKRLESIVRKLKVVLGQTDDYVGVETDFNSTYLFFFWQGAKIRKMRCRRLLGKVRRTFAAQAVNQILRVLTEHRGNKG